MQVLTWNLFHGRAQPPAGRDLLDAFAAAIAGWSWDVALLQEVPPWWPRPLGERSRASARMALTSRTLLLPLRRAVAVRWPDVVRSGGGGCNAILVRGRAIVEHRTAVLTCLPERRVLHAVRLDDGTWVANVHASKQEPRARTERDLARAAAALGAWTAGEPRVVLGGDLNLRDPDVPGFSHLAGHGVDHVLARGFARDGRPEVLDPRPLSDHRPVLVTLRPLA
jgi:endonuclease/exonuclease/phosphatase family metal-dependent hydrolase